MSQLPSLIILMRHGIAVETSSWQGSDDDRPLTGEGVKKSRQVAEGILSEYVPSTIVTSGLVRAIQTADAVDVACSHQGIKHPHRVVTDSLHHGSNFSAWKKFLEGLGRDLEPDEIVLAVGHEPSISRILSGHLGLKEPVFSFKKAGVAVVRPVQSIDRCELVAFLPPRFLRGKVS